MQKRNLINPTLFPAAAMDSSIVASSCKPDYFCTSSPESMVKPCGLPVVEESYDGTTSQNSPARIDEF